jgi:hypothetical protein
MAKKQENFFMFFRMEISMKNSGKNKKIVFFGIVGISQNDPIFLKLN